MKIQKGKILVYRVFDVGDEIDLESALRVLEQSSSPLRFRLKRESRAMVIKNAPLLLSLGNWEYQFLGKEAHVESLGKLWHFGVFSICFMITLPEGLPWSELIKYASFLESDSTLDQMAKKKTSDLVEQISGIVKNKKVISDFFEDYMIHFIEQMEGGERPIELLDKVSIDALILAENRERDDLSIQLKSSLKDNVFQYTDSDLAIIDWNSALIVEPTGVMDVPDVIEFALCQLLEMRYYDDVLDELLGRLYNSVREKKKNLLTNRYSVLSEEAAKKYLEISEIIESVQNSMKVVGDFYLAIIFRASLRRFRFGDWQTSVDTKLKNLVEVSRLLHSEVHEQRSLLLELVVIVLIAICCIPIIQSFWT